MTRRTEPNLILDADDEERAHMDVADDTVTIRKFRKTEARTVVLTGITLSFWSLVWFMIKWAVASIPAAIILVAVFALVPEMLSRLALGS